MQRRFEHGTAGAYDQRPESSSKNDRATTGTVQVRNLTRDDWPAVRQIYIEGISTGNATFESQPPEWDEFDSGTLAVGRLVAEGEDGTIHGWTSLSPTSSRPAYRGVVEHSIFVAEQSRHRGIGRQLLTALVEATRRSGIWTVQAHIFPENAACVGLHLKTGFRAVGRRHRIAEMTYGPWAGRWRDAVLVELRL